MPFCSNCGTKLPEGAAFCSGCGTRQAIRAQQPAQPQQPAYQQPAYYGYVPAKKKTPVGVFIGIAAAFVVIVAVVGGLLLFGGGGLKDFDYDDIVGQYSGTITHGAYKLSGDWKEYADSEGESLATVEDMIDKYNKDYKGEKLGIRVTLYKDSLYFYCPEFGIFFDDSSLTVDDFEIGDNGVAKGTFKEEYYGATITIKYRVTLKADGEDYRLVGDVTYSSGTSFE